MIPVPARLRRSPCEGKLYWFTTTCTPNFIALKARVQIMEGVLVNDFQQCTVDPRYYAHLERKKTPRYCVIAFNFREQPRSSFLLNTNIVYIKRLVNNVLLKKVCFLCGNSSFVTQSCFGHVWPGASGYYVA